jgi:hypothetical protein
VLLAETRKERPIQRYYLSQMIDTRVSVIEAMHPELRIGMGLADDPVIHCWNDRTDVDDKSLVLIS